MPKISIIVPVYNVEDYLENCIDSILNQTFKDFELILVNDGSTDKSLEICEHYKDIDDRVCIIDKKNGGLSSARNAGLNIAKGEYIGFVDSDDYIHPQMYEILYNQIVKNQADISICNYEEVYNYDEGYFQYNENNKSDIIIEYLSNIQSLERIDSPEEVIFVVAWNKLYKREIFKDLRYKHGIIHEDEYIIHRILYKCEKVVYIKSPLYFYMQRDGSIMQKRTQITRIDYLLALSDRIKFFDEKGLKDLQNKYERLYFVEMFNIYPKFKKYKNYKKKLLLRLNFLKLITILKNNEVYSFKEKVLWIIFCISPQIYIKYRNYRCKNIH